MTDQPTQAAVDETKATAQPVAEVDGARNDGDEIEKFLAEYNEGTSKASPEPAKPEQKPGTDDVSKVLALEMEVDNLKRFVTADKDRADFVKAAQEIRGDADSEIFSDGMIRGWITSRSKADIEKIDKIFDNRDRDPSAYKRMIAGLKRDFERGPLAKLRKLPDKQITEDHEAVAAAVRGASTKAPEGKAPDYSGMTNAEFREAHKRDYGYYPPV